MIQKLQSKLIQFMKGRYGRIDSLNKTMIIISLILLFIANFGFLWPLRIIAYGLFFYAYYRVFSKKIYVRSNENQRFIRETRPIAKKWHLWKTKFTQRKTYRYFPCPSCKQQMRAPKGRGEIKVTCSKCHHSFVKKV